MNPHAPTGTRYPLIALLAALVCCAPLAMSQTTKVDWLDLCGKCLNPTIFSKSGIGTAHAVAEARITLEAAEGFCENWHPSDIPGACKKEGEEAIKAEAGKVYRATADCVSGKITTTTGDIYSYAGTWPGGFAKGKTRWRDASGKIVETDEASEGLPVATQWEVLCGGALRPHR